MKKLLLVIVALLIGLSSCKKTVNNYAPNTPNIESAAIISGQNRTHTDQYIKDHSWKIVFVDSDSGVRLWKLQEANGSNNYIIVDPVDGTLFWRKADNGDDNSRKYVPGYVFISGEFVFALSGRQNK